MNRKSKFWSFRNGEFFKETFSPVALLHIISTVRLRKALRVISPAAVLILEPGNLFRLHDLFFGIPLLILLDLTLPPASPPRSPGLQRHPPLAFSRSRATPGAESRRDQFPLRTEDLKVEILIRPLDTSKWKF